MKVSGELHVPALYPRERAPQYLLDRSILDPVAGLDAVEKRIILPLPRTEFLPYSL
jgi:hypothetical protein